MLFASINSYYLTNLYWILAVIGTTLFGLRMSLMLLGGFIDFHHDDGHHGHTHDTSSSLKIITLHSLSGFCMMFGWAGLAASEQLGLSNGYSLLIACISGFVVMICAAFLFKCAQKLEASGAHFAIQQTLGKTGMVYHAIPAHGLGKIHINVHGITRELLAQSLTNESIESFEAIKVINIIDQETVLVVLLRKEQP